jgi:hypothetical protein
MKRHCSPGESIKAHHNVAFTLILTYASFGSFCSGITYYPPKSWATLLPTCLVSAFFAAPLLYAACNILATPKVDSIYTIWDEHSREPNLKSNGYVNRQWVNLTSDVSMWRLQQICIISYTYCIITNRSIVPEICDLDVAAINALVDYNESVKTVDGTWHGLSAFRIEKIRKVTLVRGTQGMISDA